MGFSFNRPKILQTSVMKILEGNTDRVRPTILKSSSSTPPIILRIHYKQSKLRIGLYQRFHPAVDYFRDSSMHDKTLLFSLDRASTSKADDRFFETFLHEVLRGEFVD